MGLGSRISAQIPDLGGAEWRTYVILRLATVAVSIIAMFCWAYVLQTATPDTVEGSNGQRIGPGYYSEATVFLAGVGSIIWALMTAAFLFAMRWRPSPLADMATDFAISIVALWATVYPMFWSGSLRTWLDGKAGPPGLGACALTGMICTGSLMIIHLVFFFWACRRFRVSRQQAGSVAVKDRPKSLAYELGIKFDFEKGNRHRQKSSWVETWTKDDDDDQSLHEA